MLVRAGLMSVLLDQRPSLLTLRQWFLTFVRMIHRYCSAVRLLRDVHVGRTAFAFSHRPVVWFTSSISEVSRFSCTELLDVRGVYDYAGPARSSRYRSRSCCLPLCRQRRRPDCNFSKLDTQPIYAPVYASISTSRRVLQNSGPSGSLLLPRKALSSSTLCRFIPALRQLFLPTGSSNCRRTTEKPPLDKSERRPGTGSLRSYLQAHSSMRICCGTEGREFRASPRLGPAGASEWWTGAHRA